MLLLLILIPMLILILYIDAIITLSVSSTLS